MKTVISFTFSSVYFTSLGAVVLEQDSAAAQQYSRQGCPTGLRADLWALILNSTNQPQVRCTFTNMQPGCTAVEADGVCY